MYSISGRTKAVNVLISAILLTIVTIVIVGVLWLVALPQINDLQATQRFEETKLLLRNIDSAITEVAQVNGSQTALQANLNEVALDVNRDSDQIALVVSLPSESTLLPVGETVSEGSIFIFRSGTQARLFLDYNNSGIDLNNSTHTAGGVKTLLIKDVNHSNGKALIEIQVR